MYYSSKLGVRWALRASSCKALGSPKPRCHPVVVHVDEHEERPDVVRRDAQGVHKAAWRNKRHPDGPDGYENVGFGMFLVSLGWENASHMMFLRSPGRFRIGTAGESPSRFSSMAFARSAKFKLDRWVLLPSEPPAISSGPHTNPYSTP